MIPATPATDRDYVNRRLWQQVSRHRSGIEGEPADRATGIGPGAVAGTSRCEENRPPYQQNQ